MTPSSCPRFRLTIGNDGIDISKLRADAWNRYLRSRFRQHRVRPITITYIDGRLGHAHAPRLRNRGPRQQLLVPRGRLSAAVRRAPQPRHSSRPGKHSMAPQLAERGNETLLQCVPQAAPTRWRFSRRPPTPSRRSTRSTTIRPTRRRSSRARQRLLAKMPTIAAWAYKKSIGHPYVYPRNDLNYVENFLHMMFALPTED